MVSPTQRYSALYTREATILSHETNFTRDFSRKVAPQWYVTAPTRCARGTTCYAPRVIILPYPSIRNVGYTPTYTLFIEVLSLLSQGTLEAD